MTARDPMSEEGGGARWEVLDAKAVDDGSAQLWVRLRCDKGDTFPEDNELLVPASLLAQERKRAAEFESKYLAENQNWHSLYTDLENERIARQSAEKQRDEAEAALEGKGPHIYGSEARKAQAAESQLAAALAARDEALARVARAKEKLDEAVMESRHGRTASTQWIDKQVDEARSILAATLEAG